MYDKRWRIKCETFFITNFYMKGIFFQLNNVHLQVKEVGIYLILKKGSKKRGVVIFSRFFIQSVLHARFFCTAAQRKVVFSLNVSSATWLMLTSNKFKCLTYINDASHTSQIFDRHNKYVTPSRVDDVYCDSNLTVFAISLAFNSPITLKSILTYAYKLFFNCFSLRIFCKFKILKMESKNNV